MKQDTTQEQIKDMLLEAKNYYGLQKEYFKLTATEKLTVVLSKILLALIVIILVISIIMFLGLALVHWIGEAIGNIGICYAGFSLFIAIILLFIYTKRRKYIILPIAKMMTQVILAEDDDKNNKNSDERAK